jgi:putative toxin-antitoxin system antitoxin component (TIGR02293 family)
MSEKEINTLLEEPLLAYGYVEGKNSFSLLDLIKEGLKFTIFANLTKNLPFNLMEWSQYLHLSERTMQRYNKEKKVFEATYAEKIIQILLVYNYGKKVFGSKEKFDLWLNTTNIALGRKQPKEFLDTHIGISLIKDELLKIEHGVLA